MHPWNEPILESLKKARERLPHALLIHGPRGVGKLALAERFVQLLLCEHRDPAARPCGSCDACRCYATGNHPHFRRVEPEAIAKMPSSAELQREVRRTEIVYQPVTQGSAGGEVLESAPVRVVILVVPPARRRP